MRFMCVGLACSRAVEASRAGSKHRYEHCVQRRNTSRTRTWVSPGAHAKKLLNRKSQVTTQHRAGDPVGSSRSWRKSMTSFPDCRPLTCATGPSSASCTLRNQAASSSSDLSLLAEASSPAPSSGSPCLSCPACLRLWLISTALGYATSIMLLPVQSVTCSIPNGTPGTRSTYSAAAAVILPYSSLSRLSSSSSGWVISSESPKPP